MIARVGGSGILLRFNKSDKPVLEQGGTLDTIFQDYLRPTLVLHVCDTVEKEDPDAENGFKVNVEPFGQPDRRTSYEIWMSRENAERLIREGYWSTRSIISRVDMSYRE